MNRNFSLSILGLLVLGITGCGHQDTTPPAAPAVQVPDAELQQMEEDAFRDREQQAQVE